MHDTERRKKLVCKIERNHNSRFSRDKKGGWPSIIMTVMVVGITLITLGCATVPTGPLAPGELRLTTITAPEKIKAGVPYDVVISFQANDPVQIMKGCFYWQIGAHKARPYCFHIREINLETKTFKVRLNTKNPN